MVQRLGCLPDLHRAEVPACVRSELIASTQGASTTQLGPPAKWGYAGKPVQSWKVA